MASTRPRFDSITTLTGATLTVTAAAHAGHTIVSNLAATQTITLPAATGTGNRYGFFVAITKTGDLIIQKAGSDVMNGGVIVATDTSGIPAPAAVTDNTLTMNGSTTGGVVGSYCEFIDVISGVWNVTGFLNATGAESTPFS